MNIYNQYLRGGVEWLHNEFFKGINSQEEYLKKINEITSDYKRNFFGCSEE